MTDSVTQDFNGWIGPPGGVTDRWTPSAPLSDPTSPTRKDGLVPASTPDSSDPFASSVITRDSIAKSWSPQVRHLANELGVDPAKLMIGTGPNCAVTLADVRRHASSVRGQRDRSSTTSPAARTLLEERRSVWSGAKKVRVDAYAANPLVDDARQAQPSLFALANAEAPTPTLFSSGGDLPIWMTSGADPDLLTNLPWQARHPAAAADAAGLTEILERYASSPDSAALQFGSHPGNQAYRQRVSSWLSGSGVDRKQPTTASRERLQKAAEREAYDNLYGAQATFDAEQRARDEATQQRQQEIARLRREQDQANRH